MERKLEISRQFDTVVETEIDLTAALAGVTGHLILYIEPEGGMLSALLNRQLQDTRIISWVQVTEIGLDAFVDADEMHVWANSLVDGAPLGEVEVDLWPQDVRQLTDATGTARVRLPRNSAQLLIARHGDDVAFLPENRYEYYRTETVGTDGSSAQSAPTCAILSLTTAKCTAPAKPSASKVGCARLNATRKGT